MPLTHFNEQGDAHMVDVSQKTPTHRVATAVSRVTMKPETLKLMIEGKAAKGDVLGVARLAGIMAAKKTADLIPLCHPIPIHSVDIDLKADEKESCVDVRGVVTTDWKTGVEMDALTAVTVAGLTVYDMLKSVDKDMVISDIMVIEKSGGKSGHYLRTGEKSSHNESPRV
ncbi:Cyclic pyranopterin monophosphate synthase accessory protein [hydrothermal vent metagenome]|uniref:cyclic pyranopterin monophosphate synthase n=1 Tax=hydrothermal vent metagenome TaxID=652676 RepID=A0A3B1CE78_9ZZZZ